MCKQKFDKAEKNCFCGSKMELSPQKCGETRKNRIFSDLQKILKKCLIPKNAVKRNGFKKSKMDRKHFLLVLAEFFFILYINYLY